MAKALPLTDVELTKKFKSMGLNVPVIIYKDLKHYEDLDQLLPCIILYQNHHPIGHFVCIFENDEGINYFDSTGRIPDKLIIENFDNPQGRIVSGADFTYLNNLLLHAINKTGKPLVYNEKVLQSSGTAVCGHYCFVRLIFSHLTNDEFNEIFIKIPVKKRQEVIYQLYQKLK